MSAVSGSPNGLKQVKPKRQVQENRHKHKTALISRRERIQIGILSWLIALALHGIFYIGLATYLDYKQANFELEIAWDDAPLSGFGMMDGYWSELSHEDIEEFDDIEADASPFEEAELELEPKLDANEIEAPELEDVQAPDPALPSNEDAPKYDLSKDKARLAALREDMASMPNLPTMVPGNAKLIVLIRNDRIRNGRFDGGVRKLFRSFPDFQVTLGKGDIDPLDSVDALLIATSNPQLFAETFLVVSHRIPSEKLKATIDASFPVAINWESFRGRPLATPDRSDGKYHPSAGIYQRSVYLPTNELVLFLRPSALPSLSTEQIDGLIGNAKDLENPSTKEGRTPTFLDGFSGIKDSDSSSTPALFLALQGIESLSFGPRFPKFTPPIGIQASLATSDNPEVNMALSFMDPQEADHFVKVWPDIIKASGKLGIPGLSGMLSGLSLAAEQRQIFVTGKINGTFVSLVLLFASSRLERINR